MVVWYLLYSSFPFNLFSFNFLLSFLDVPLILLKRTPSSVFCTQAAAMNMGTSQKTPEEGGGPPINGGRGQVCDYCTLFYFISPVLL